MCIYTSGDMTLKSCKNATDIVAVSQSQAAKEKVWLAIGIWKETTCRTKFIRAITQNKNKDGGGARAQATK